MLAVALLFGELVPPGSDLVIGAVAGLAGTLGLAAFYRGLAIHQMGIVAPIAAAVTALVPVGLGAVIEGLPAVTQMIGFGLAILAIWIMSWTGGQIHMQLRVLTLPVVAGLGFAFFLIGIDQASHHAVLWPLVGARIAGISMLFAVVMARRQWETPCGNQLPIRVYLTPRAMSFSPWRPTLAGLILPPFFRLSIQLPRFYWPHGFSMSDSTGSNGAGC
jgi:hypothetical protein